MSYNELCDILNNQYIKQPAQYKATTKKFV